MRGNRGIIKRFSRGEDVKESRLPEYANEPVDQVGTRVRGVDVVTHTTREKPVLIQPVETKTRKGEDTVTRVESTPPRKPETLH